MVAQRLLVNGESWRKEALDFRRLQSVALG